VQTSRLWDENQVLSVPEIFHPSLTYLSLMISLHYVLTVQQYFPDVTSTRTRVWHVSSMDGKNWGVSIMEEILSSLPFWEET